MITKADAESMARQAVDKWACSDPFETSRAKVVDLILAVQRETAQDCITSCLCVKNDCIENGGFCHCADLKTKNTIETLKTIYGLK